MRTSTSRSVRSWEFPLVTPEWSLFYEVILSALFGLILHRMTTPALVVVAVVCLTGYTAALNTYTAFTLPLSANFSPALASFTLGLLLHRAFPLLPALPAPFWLPAGMLVAVTCTQASWGPELDLACLVLVLPAVILTGIAARGPAIRLAGELSYPVYILHWPVLVACNTVLLPRIGTVPALLAGCGLSVAAAWMALRFYDEPLRAALGRRTRKRILTAAAAE